MRIAYSSSLGWAMTTGSTGLNFRTCLQRTLDWLCGSQANNYYNQCKKNTKTTKEIEVIDVGREEIKHFPYDHPFANWCPEVFVFKVELLVGRVCSGWMQVQSAGRRKQLGVEEAMLEGMTHQGRHVASLPRLGLLSSAPCLCNTSSSSSSPWCISTNKSYLNTEICIASRLRSQKMYIDSIAAGRVTKSTLMKSRYVHLWNPQDVYTLVDVEAWSYWSTWYETQKDFLPLEVSYISLAFPALHWGLVFKMLLCLWFHS